MKSHSRLPTASEIIENAGKILVLEAESGSRRRDLLLEWSRQVAEQGISCRPISCDFELGGPWAGVQEIFEELLPSLMEQAPDLITRHDYEIVTVLPSLRHSIAPRNLNLTDLAPDLERVRLYPADRAHRIVHGLIDLLAEWKERQGNSCWLFVCDSFDRGSHLVRRFFAELIRRKGTRYRFVLLAACAPGRSPAGDLFAFAEPMPWIRLRLDPDAAAPADPRRAAAEAEALEQQAAADPDHVERYLPALIRLWSQSDQPSRGFAWQLRALRIFGPRGFYQDALPYGEAALANPEANHVNAPTYAFLVNLLASCYNAIGQPERALEITRAALDRLRPPVWRARMRYVLAMLYARYLPQKDLARAERELETAVPELMESDIDAWERCFEIAFNRNGLALVRHRQGRPLEALDLCSEAYQSLTANLASSEHRLHKSVLIYNQAQVLSSLGDFETAVSYITAAIEADPNYAEYYNDRGNAILKLGRLDGALADYRRSEALSPPFPEVRVNIGHCYRLMGELGKAVEAYTGALDLNPGQANVLVVCAECHEGLGLWDVALQDYDAALRVQPEQPLVLANRARLLFQEGRLGAALDDLDRAVALAPGIDDLYRNRAVVLAALEECERAAADLETYLRLCDGAADREEVEREISSLRRRPTLTAS